MEEKSKKEILKKITAHVSDGVGTVSTVFLESDRDKFPFSAKVAERLKNEPFGTKLKIF